MLFQVLIMFFPWWLRRPLLCWRYGFKIDKHARIGYSLILPKRLEMAKDARIHHLVICKPIDLLSMGPDSGIGSMTFITGIPTSNAVHFRHVESRKCELVLGRGVGITGRHYIDCNGGVYVDCFTTIAGLRSQILTHSIDIYNCRQHAAPVHIGKFCFIGTNCVILPGASLPDYSVLGACAVLNKTYTESCMLYAGTPARPRKKINFETTPYFHRVVLNVV